MNVRWTLGALLVAAAMGIGASEARAQSCAIPDDVPAEVYDAYIDLLGPGFPMSFSACDKLVKNVVSTCHKSVAAAARCWGGLAKGLAKGAKTTCPEQGGDEGPCFEGTGAQILNLRSNVEASESDGHAECDAGAPQLRGWCQFGLP